MIITIATSLRYPLAQPFFVHAKQGMDLVDWDVVLGGPKLGDACDVPDAGAAAWPATSLAEAKPDCTVHVATRRSRWSACFASNNAPDTSNCWRHPA